MKENHMKLLIIAVIIILIVIIAVSMKKENPWINSLLCRPVRCLVIDVRSKQEFDAGHFSTAINIPHDQIANQIDNLNRINRKTILLYAISGKQGRLLQKRSFGRMDLSGG